MGAPLTLQGGPSFPLQTLAGSPSQPLRIALLEPQQQLVLLQQKNNFKKKKQPNSDCLLIERTREEKATSALVAFSASTRINSLASQLAKCLSG